MLRLELLIAVVSVLARRYCTTSVFLPLPLHIRPFLILLLRLGLEKGGYCALARSNVLAAARALGRCLAHVRRDGMPLQVSPGIRLAHLSKHRHNALKKDHIPTCRHEDQRARRRANLVSSFPGPYFFILFCPKDCCCGTEHSIPVHARQFLGTQRGDAPLT